MSLCNVSGLIGLTGKKIEVFLNPYKIKTYLEIHIHEIQIGAAAYSDLA